MSNNLADVLQHWLQGQINTTVDGHSARLEYLEAAVTHAQYLDERIKRLEAQMHSANVRLLNLEKAYPDMATTKDLLKDTDPERLLDKMHPKLIQLFQTFLQDYVKEIDLEENVEAILDRRPQSCDADKLDALRYRWLRDQHWSDGIVAVVNNPKNNVMIGTQCFSSGLLDAFIDERLQK